MAHIPERPTEVKLGPFTWKIKFGDGPLKDLEDCGAGDMFGVTKPRKHEILVATEGRPEQAVRETVLHEVLHACIHTYSINMPEGDNDHDKEEQVVSTMAIPLLQVIQDNPILMRWLREEL